MAPSASLLKLLKEVKGDVHWTNIFACFATELFHNVEWPIFALAQLTDLLYAVQLKPQFVNTVIWCFQLNEILHIRKLVTLMTILTIIRCLVLLALSITNQW